MTDHTGTGGSKMRDEFMWMMVQQDIQEGIDSDVVCEREGESWAAAVWWVDAEPHVRFVLNGLCADGAQQYRQMAVSWV